MGVVYEAEDLKLHRRVALKFLPEELSQDHAARQRFEREALAASSLNHPNICTIYDIDEDQGESFLVMEFLEGQTLEREIALGPLHLKLLLTYSIAVAAALEAAHGKSIIHRDIKPSNLFVTTSGHLKLLDFGLAKVARNASSEAATQATSLTGLNAVLGTVPYMSPEQLRGRELDARTDLFSLGVVMYQLATGVIPFRGSTSAVVADEIMNRDPVPPAQLNPAVPMELQRIIAGLLQKDRELRYQTAAEVKADLIRLLQKVSGQEQALHRPTSEPRGDDAVALLPASPSTWQSMWGTGKPALGPRSVLQAASKRRWVVIVLSIAAIASMSGVVLYVQLRHRVHVTEKDAIVLADVANSTGDPIFDETLKQALIVQLEQSPFLNIISDRRVAQTLRQMGRSPEQPLTMPIARELCQRVNSRILLAGSIASLGSQYVIGLKATNCTTGDTLAAEQAQASGKEQVLKALDAAASGLRRKLGETLASLNKYDTPLEQATTPSLEALRAYSLGVKELRSKGEGAPIPFLKRAVELDPRFAVAYSRLGNSYYNLGQIGLAAENTRKAYELRQQVSERERLFIEGFYYHYVSGELPQAATAYELLQQAYPHDMSAYSNLGSVYASLGKHEDALFQVKEALRLDPNDGIKYLNVGNAYLNLGRLDEAESAYRESERRKLESEALIASRYQIAFLKNDAKAMQEFVAAAMGKLGTEDLLLAMEADTQAWYGRLRAARKLTQQAVESAQSNQFKESAATYQIQLALREVEFGNTQKALAETRAALSLATNRDVDSVAALVLARGGDIVGSQKLSAELNKAFPLDSLVQSYWLPSIRAATELNRGRPEIALEELRRAIPYDIGVPTQTMTVVLYPAFLRGEAYLKLNNGIAAAAEFHKIIDHSGLVANFPLGALARLGLARACVLEADHAKVRTAYQDFLLLWKNADPDVPIYKEAQAEYARVQ